VFHVVSLVVNEKWRETSIYLKHAAACVLGSNPQQPLQWLPHLRCTSCLRLEDLSSRKLEEHVDDDEQQAMRAERLALRRELRLT
jgi:hypothetical protein